jgi:hypothetical protein
MEEQKSIWKKTANELTVKDQLVVSAVITGGLLAIGVGFTAVARVEELLWNRKQAKKNKNVIDV